MVDINQNLNLPSTNEAVANNAALPPMANEANADQANQTADPNLTANDIIKNELSSVHGANSKLKKLIIPGMSMAQLLAATPVVFSALLNQANNIAVQGKKGDDKGVLGFFGIVADSLAGPFRFLQRRYITKNNNDDDVSANKKAYLTDDVLKRAMHPKLAKEFTNLLFTGRRVMFNLFPGLSTVPSQEHNPLEPSSGSASKITANVFKSFSTFFAPFRFLTTGISALAMIPGNLIGTFSAFEGNQKLVDTSKLFSKITDIFNPIVANMSSLYSTSKAFMDSAYKGESKEVSFGRYNVGFTHLVQGIVGSFISVPYFFASFAKIHELVNSKDPMDPNGKRKIVSDIETMVGELSPHLKTYGLLTDHSVSDLQIKAGNFLDKALNQIEVGVIKVLETFYNLNSFTKSIFSKIRPVDQDGRIIAHHDDNHIDSAASSGKYMNIANHYFNKSNFFKEAYSILRPLQSMIMLLPNAFVSMNDPYIADNAKTPLRVADRLIGILGTALSLPNYIAFGISTRVPQVVLKHFENKQRKAEAQGDYEYSAFHDYQSFIEGLERNPIIGAGYLASRLRNLDVNEHLFKEDREMEKLFDSLEEDAQEQESTVKTSEMITAIRIGMRNLLTTKFGQAFLFAKRDENGLTAEEHSRQKIYNGIGTFKEGLARIPIVGMFASPLIETFRSFYKVKIPKNRKVLGAPAVAAPAAMPA